MGSHRERRKKGFYGPAVRFLTDELERNFVLKFCAVVIIGAALSGGLIYWRSAETLTTVFHQGRLKITSTADFILPAVFLSSAVVIIFIGLFLSLVIFVAYRRMEASLRQIKYEIEKADSGDLEGVHLNFKRRDDEFKVIALAMNRMVQDLKDAMILVKHSVSSLEVDCRDLDSGDALARQKVKQGVQRLKEELSRFKVGL
ncbi:MAG TPA: hypothetical protein DCL35_03090 [Candidatus Omnitrophica bacterium]|nr:hypothetical protein [Candidatus Omnitrophota bacterium]